MPLDVLKVTSALLIGFFGHGERQFDGAKKSSSVFLWEDPLRFTTCMEQLPELEAVWTSIGTVLQTASPRPKLWGFSTPDEDVRHREVQQLARLGRILQQLPGLLHHCGLQGKEKKMFQQSLAVFESPPERVLNAAASSLFILEQHWTANAWQDPLNEGC
eukprot:g27425.t1